MSKISKIITSGVCLICLFGISFIFNKHKKIRQLRDIDITSIIDITNVASIPIGETRIVRGKITNSQPSFYNRIFYEEVDIYTHRFSESPYNNKSLWNLHVYKSPLCTSLVPVFSYYWNLLCENINNITIQPVQNCQIPLSDDLCTEQKKLSGIMLVKNYINDIPQTFLHCFETINMKQFYVLKHFNFNNKTVYINATRIDSNKIIYNIFTPNIDDLLDYKYSFLNNSISCGIGICGIGFIALISLLR